LTNFQKFAEKLPCILRVFSKNAFFRNYAGKIPAYLKKSGFGKN